MNAHAPKPTDVFRGNGAALSPSPSPARPITLQHSPPLRGPGANSGLGFGHSPSPARGLNFWNQPSPPSGGDGRSMQCLGTLGLKPAAARGTSRAQTAFRSGVTDPQELRDLAVADLVQPSAGVGSCPPEDDGDELAAHWQLLAQPLQCALAGIGVGADTLEEEFEEQYALEQPAAGDLSRSVSRSFTPASRSHCVHAYTQACRTGV